MYDREDRVKFMLGQRMSNPPNSQTAYCTGNAEILGAVISQATGMSLEEFAGRYLLDLLATAIQDPLFTYVRAAIWCRDLDEKPQID